MNKRSEENSWYDVGFSALRRAIESYCLLSETTWTNLRAISIPKNIPKDDHILHAGDAARSFGFVHRGLLRSFIVDSNGHEYNKNFFVEGTFPGSMVALLNETSSEFSIQALEDSRYIEINFCAYRELLQKQDDLKWFHILYLEKNWVLEKEKREVALVQDNATQRYLEFQQKNIGLETRISQYHVASHIGVTPTQLSRIRKNLGSA